MKHVICLLICCCALLKGQTDTSKVNVLNGDILKYSKVDILQSNSDTNQYKVVKPGMAIYDVKSNIPNDSLQSTRTTADKSSLRKINLSKGIKRIVPSGNISLGYDYGFLPYTTNMPSPSMAYKSEGKIDLNLFSLPINVSYFYSTQKNIVGLNNYFRVSYDAERYKNQLNQKLLDKKNIYKDQKGKLVSEKQDLVKKMAFADYLNSTDPVKWPKGINQSTKLSSPKITVPEITNEIGVNDSLNVSVNTNTTGFNIDKSGSVGGRLDDYKRKSDSVRTVYEKYRSQYEQLSDSIKKIDSELEKLESFKNGNDRTYAKNSEYFTKYQNFISGVKRFEIGLCYPNYSTFLANNLPVRGINFEYNKDSRYLAFTYGTTVSTLLYNSNTSEGVLRNVRNAYNYFDANNLVSGRKILSVKLGSGTKEGNHFFIGMLLGRGQTSYRSFLNGENVFTGRESNIVLEADVRYKLAKAITLDVNLGKSSLRGEDFNLAVFQEEMKEVFSKYRSNALLAKISTGIKRTNTNVSLVVRYVDPFFKSFGIGFMRSDNLRYELKLDQPIGKKLKYSGAFRYEEDNLLQLLNYKNQFYSINNALVYRLKRGLILRIIYTPLLRTLRSENYYQITRNSISTGVITYNTRTKNSNLQFNLLYNHYVINTDTQQIHFENISYSQQIVFKQGLKIGLSASWFKNTLADSLNNDVILAIADLGYQFKNGNSMSVAGKTAYKIGGIMYPGFILKCNFRISKNLFIESQAEKFVIGDLFNGYDLYNLKKFPYYFSTKLLLNF
jgi:hypothetical protein